MEASLYADRSSPLAIPATTCKQRAAQPPGVIDHAHRISASCDGVGWYGREGRKLPVSATRSPVCAAPGLQPRTGYGAVDAGGEGNQTCEGRSAISIRGWERC